MTDTSGGWRIVITGATGYVGSALADDLGQRGYRLRLVSRRPWPVSDQDADSGVERITGDLSLSGTWEEVLEGVDAVVHLAARTDLRAAELDPDEDGVLNVKPVQMLVNALRATGHSELPVIFASTVTVFGPNPPTPVNEAVADDPVSVYDLHKLECEQILRGATGEGLVSACTLRLANVYGYGLVSRNANRGILNAMMRRAVAGQALTLYGDGRYVRDFVHLNDVVTAFRLAIEVPAVRTGGFYVIASEDGRPLREVFQMVADEAGALTGRNIAIIQLPEPQDLHPIERRTFIGDSGLFRRRTGWRRQGCLEDNIRRDVALFFSHQAATTP